MPSLIAVVVYARSGEAGKSIAVVEVVAAVIEPATRTEKRTNTFYFTFSFNSPIPSLQPVLYEDAIKVHKEDAHYTSIISLILFLRYLVP